LESSSNVRRAASLAFWYALLFGFWELLVGTFNSTELFAGLIAAAVGAAFAELIRSLGLLRFPGATPASWLAIGRLGWQLPLEFLIIGGALFRALARGRRLEGEWVRVPFEGDAGRRALAAVIGTASPNAIVVDVNDGQVLLHSIAPSLPGGKEAI
jgi:multisubunit Na+/H+ antiporter MnhE subunit